MEGYSVTEAASILGVPTERVWELLARGVLSGSPEGETGMRVFLQPRPAPAPPVPEAARTNGDAGTREPERELSPFRELLTEFRNLTERYGQALLALGESRGEVASLRSRVDLLEARMDLRLPMGPAAPATGGGWPTPVSAAAAPEAAGTPIAVDEPHHDEEDEDRPRRRRGHRRATESFAEALARAEDPTRPELPGAAETAAAIAAYRDDAVPEGEHAAEAVLPREMPAAEPMPLPEEPEATSADPTIESPDAVTTAEAATTFQAADTETEAAAAFAESVASELAVEPTPSPDVHDRAADFEAEAAAAPTEIVVEEGGAAVEPMAPPVSDAVAPAETHVIEAESVPAADEETLAPVLAAETARAPEVDIEPSSGVEQPAPTADDFVAVEAPTDAIEAAEEPPPAEAAEEPALIAAAEAEAPRAPSVEEPPADEEPEPVTASAATTEAEQEPEPIAWDPERYTAEIIEPDWYADEQAEAFAPAPASAAPPAVEAEREAEPEAQEAAADTGEPPVTSPPPAPSPPGGEETMLWFGQGPQDAAVDEGADEMESVGAAPRSAPAPVPGSKELDEALAALEALSRGTTTTPDPPSEPSAEESWPPAHATQGSPVDASAALPELDVSDDTSSSSAGLLPSVRPQATSASRAYRRLRRIFPG